MKGINIIIGGRHENAVLAAPQHFAGELHLGMPEFYGKTDGRPFGIVQVISWNETERQKAAVFVLDGDPAETGIEYEGEIRSASEDCVAFEASVHNLHVGPIYAAHHTFLLDTTALPRFDDPSGDRTFVYTNVGWCTAADLLSRTGPNRATLRVGASYSGNRTVIWKVIARADDSGKYLLALGLDRGYAFSSNHPEWPKGLLGGCRWGTLDTDETKTVHGRIYLMQGTLEDLRARYVADFK